MPTAPSEDVVLRWFDQLSNWERWGPDDRLGTLNHVTPAKRVAAAGLVRTASRCRAAGTCAPAVSPGPRWRTSGTCCRPGLGLADEGRKQPARRGSRRRGAGVHRDGLPRPRRHPPRLAGPHLLGRQDVRRRAGVDGVGPSGGAGARRAGRRRTGVTTRGVLLDIARLRGVDVLAADDHVYPEDLEPRPTPPASRSSRATSS